MFCEAFSIQMKVNVTFKLHPFVVQCNIFTSYSFVPEYQVTRLLLLIFCNFFIVDWTPFTYMDFKSITDYDLCLLCPVPLFCWSLIFGLFLPVQQCMQWHAQNLSCQGIICCNVVIINRCLVFFCLSGLLLCSIFLCITFFFLFGGLCFAEPLGKKRLG